jgi:C4-dicarboxylate-specific signal transduction histidine kinase
MAYYQEQVVDVANEIFETIERAVDKMYRIESDLHDFASNNEFKLADIKDADVIAMITPLLNDLVLGYLEAARETETEFDEE